MAKKKKKTSKNKDTLSSKFIKFKKNNAELYNLIKIFIIFVFLIVSSLRMGAFGKLLDNSIKYLSGNISYIIYIMLFFFVINSIFKLNIKNKFLIYLDTLILALILEIIYFNTNTYSVFSFQYVTENYHTFLGGGLLLKIPTKSLIYLFSYYGALIISISTFIFLILIILIKQYPDFINKLNLLFRNKLKNKDDIVITTNHSKVHKQNVLEEKYNEVADDSIEIEIGNYDKFNKELENNKFDHKVDSNDSIEYINNKENINYSNYILPPLSLLNDPIENKKISKDDIVSKSKILQDTFRNFGIDVKIVKAVVGPSITQFQILPTPGTKVNKIVNLSSDLALNLAAKDIRIEAPIPGKSLIGIEIPNSVNQLVSMKEIFVNNKDEAALSVCLGKDVTGESIFARLDKMPHLLVAGSTGSGKSVCVNTIITSILLKNKPDKVKLIMIDPKMVELSIYDGIPHLLTPVVTNPMKAADVLHKVVLEMERRYKEFSIARVKNIEGYNNIAKEDSDYKELPYIVVIIDELADLMMVASKEVEESIARITQMARAAGIHLIIATQRPSVDVLTGVIKSNIPSRIAFAVSSSIDSRTILDKSGAETLLGKGDMLFQSADSSKPIRVQGAFLSDIEVENIVDFIKNQASSEYDPSMLPSENSSKSSTNDDEVDPLYKEVLIFIAKTQKASASLLQRRFKIGYNRAARIIEMLEEDGYIGAVDGSKPRKVFLEPEYAENNQ